jgi:hypothetical protein
VCSIVISGKASRYFARKENDFLMMNMSNCGSNSLAKTAKKHLKNEKKGSESNSALS